MIEFGCGILFGIVLFYEFTHNFKYTRKTLAFIHKKLKESKE